MFKVGDKVRIIVYDNIGADPNKVYTITNNFCYGFELEGYPFTKTSNEIELV